MTRESDLSAPVSAWLEAQVLTVWAEVPIRYGTADLVGYSGATDRLIVVELKTSASQALLYQCRMARTVTRYVYGATATAPKLASRDRFLAAGIGLLRVINGAVITTLAPCEHEDGTETLRDCPPDERYRAKFIKRLTTHPRGGKGGLTSHEVRPAHNVLLAVIEYLREHPMAPWREVYAEVPNHYAHARSMGQTMRERVKFNIDRPAGWKLVLERGSS